MTFKFRPNEDGYIEVEVTDWDGTRSELLEPEDAREAGENLVNLAEEMGADGDE